MRNYNIERTDLIPGIARRFGRERIYRTRRTAHGTPRYITKLQISKFIDRN